MSALHQERFNSGTTAPLLRVHDLHKHFPLHGGLLGRRGETLAAVAGVSFDIERGRTLGLVGESGCGKTTLARMIVGLHSPTSGEILLEGERLSGLTGAQWRAHRRSVQMIFQDPHASLDPRYTVARTLREPLDVHAIGAPGERDERVRELIDAVGLPTKVLPRYPHELSGGQRQRVGIARALALEPKLIVADEPVSSLDVSVRAQILELLARLQRERGIAFLLISHDLAVVQHMSHDVAVMHRGRIVEHAPVDELYRAPRHAYTQALLAAVPTLRIREGSEKGQRAVRNGSDPSLTL